MSVNWRTTRRNYVKATVAGVTGLTGLSASAAAGQGGPIQMGSILPITGSLSAYGEGMQRAVNIAVQDVNDAGGPLDRQINMSNTDSQTQPSRAVQQYNTLVNEQNIIGFVGAASSGVSVPLAQNVAADQVMQVSHASTTPSLAEIGYSDDQRVKYFGRTAPNDAQQGILMGRILSDDEYVGADRAAFLYVNNPYGQGLAEQASAQFQGETVGMVGYDQQTTDYTSTLDAVFENDPDAVGFVGYPGNGRTILRQWDRGGYGGQWVSSEGVNNPEFWRELSEITDGFYVTSPDPEGTRGGQRFEEKIGRQNTLFAPHAYDAVLLQALAIQRAGEAGGTAIAENIRAVSRPAEGAERTTEGADETSATTTGDGGGQGGNVVTVGEFQKAKDLLSDDEDVDYQGASSPVDLNEALEPLNQYAIMQVRQGETEVLETVPRSFFRGKL